MEEQSNGFIQRLAELEGNLVVVVFNQSHDTRSMRVIGTIEETFSDGFIVLERDSGLRIMCNLRNVCYLAIHEPE